MILLIWLMALTWTPAPRPNWPSLRIRSTDRPHRLNLAVPMDYG